MKKQLLFLALVASVVGCNASYYREKGAELPSERIHPTYNENLENFGFQYRNEIHDTLNNLQNLLATKYKGKKINLHGKSPEWSNLVRNLNIYAGAYSTGAQRTLSTVGQAIFNTIKDTYKQLKMARAKTLTQTTARDQNIYNFLDRVLQIVKLHNQGYLQPLNLQPRNK